VRINDEQVLWSAPESERAGRPLLILLHGHNLDERVGFELRHHLPEELVLASVRAPLTATSGYAWFRLDPTVGFQQVDASSRAIVDWLETQPAAPSVGILGFSQGAATGLQVLRQAPDRFAYAAVLSGFVVPGLHPNDARLRAARTPVFWGRGDRDPVIPQPLVYLTHSWLRQHTTLEERVYPELGHNVNPAELADLSRFLRTHAVDAAQA
jgi:phospholipase/carboxylesterase